MQNKKITKKLIVANWKMNPSSLKEAIKIAKASDVNGVTLCVPSVFINPLKKVIKKAKIGAQNISTEENGAFTGEISADMIYESGARYVIVGHSERRAMGENNLDINKKIKMALVKGLSPILCVGEKERDVNDINHEYFNVVKKQIDDALDGISKNLVSKIIIAYEPVWALSTTVGRHDTTTSDCQEMVLFIKKILSDMFSQQVAQSMKILYGGSVNEKNIDDFVTNGGIDGVLVGKASLDIKKFKLITYYA